MRPTELMERARITQHNNRRIMSLDFSGLGVDDTSKVIDYSANLFDRLPEKSIYTLTNVSGADFNLKLIDTLKQFTNRNRKHVIAGAVVGAEGIKKSVFNSILLFTKRDDLKAFDNETEAIRWLSTI